MSMNDSIELKLVKLAEKIADMYASKLEPERYEQLCNAITACKEYHLENKGDEFDLTMLVLGEDGIWVYADEPEYSEEIQNMWALETNILICNCYLACMEGSGYLPQDMEIRGENIPKLVEFLEANFCENLDYDKIFQFYWEEMCY